MKSKQLVAVSIAGFVALFTTSSVSAAIITTFATRAAFDVAVGPTILEDLNSQTVGTSFNNVSLDLGDFSLLKAGAGATGFIAAGSASFNIDGTIFGRVNTFSGGDMLFTFDAPISAFGLDLDAWNDSVIRTTLTADGTTVPVTSQIGQGSRFFGFSSDMSFTTVRFVGDIGDSWGFDNISYTQNVTTVPEPGTLALISLGLAGLGFARFRRFA